MRGVLWLLGLAVFSLVLSVDARALAAERCVGPRVAVGAQAFLYTRPAVENGLELFGCLRRSRRPIMLGESYGEGASDGEWRNPTVAGHFAALEQSDRFKCERREVRVVDLRTGQLTVQLNAGTFSYSDSANACEGAGQPTTALSLRSDGLVAFVVGTPGSGYEVVRSSTSKRLLPLDRGTAVYPGFVRLTRTEVRWIAGGVVRRARVPRLPQAG